MYFNISSNKLYNQRPYANVKSLKTPNDFLEPKPTSALKPIRLQRPENFKSGNDTTFTSKLQQVEIRTNGYNDTHDDYVMNTRLSEKVLDGTKNANSNTALLTNDNSKVFYRSDGHRKPGRFINSGCFRQSSHNNNSNDFNLHNNDLCCGDEDSWLLSFIESKNEGCYSCMRFNDENENTHKQHKNKRNIDERHIKGLKTKDLIEITERRKQWVINHKQKEKEREKEKENELNIENVNDLIMENKNTNEEQFTIKSPCSLSEKIENGVQTSFIFNEEDNNILLTNNDLNDSLLDTVNQEEPLPLRFDKCINTNTKSKPTLNNNNVNTDDNNIITTNQEIFEIESNVPKTIINQNHNNSFSSNSSENNNNNIETTTNFNINPNITTTTINNTTTNNNITEFQIEENPILSKTFKKTEQPESPDNSFDIYRNDLPEVVKIQNETLEMDFTKIKNSNISTLVNNYETNNNTSTNLNNNNTLKRINYFEETLTKLPRNDSSDKVVGNIVLTTEIKQQQEEPTQPQNQFVNRRYDSDFKAKNSKPKIASLNIKNQSIPDCQDKILNKSTFVYHKVQIATSSRNEKPNNINTTSNNPNNGCNNVSVCQKKHVKTNSCGIIKDPTKPKETKRKKPELSVNNQHGISLITASTRKKIRKLNNYSEIYKNKQRTNNTLNVYTPSAYRIQNFNQNIPSTKRNKMHIDFSRQPINPLIDRSLEKDNKDEYDYQLIQRRIGNNKNSKIIDVAGVFGNSKEECFNEKENGFVICKNNSWCDNKIISKKHNQSSIN